MMQRKSRLSSAAPAECSPCADRQEEARGRRLDSGSSSDGEEQQEATLRRVTFSTGGDRAAPAEPGATAAGADAAQPAMPLGAARLWRGAAASICSGQRLQSLERHAAELKQRQEVHNELKAWAQQVLAAAQSDPASSLLDAEPEDDDCQWGELSTQQQHQQPEQQQQQDQEQEQQQVQEEQGSSTTHGEEAVAAGQQAADGAAQVLEQQVVQQQLDSEQQDKQGGVQQLALAPVQQDASQWQQFNAAEQQLIQQLQSDQQMLLEQLQQAYQHIAALTAVDAGAVAAAPSQCQPDDCAAAGALETQKQRQPDVVMHPAPDTQVLVITSNSSSPDTGGAGAVQDSACMASQTPQQQQHQPHAGQVVTRPSQSSSSTSSSPRSRLVNRAAGSAAAQPANSPRGGASPRQTRPQKAASAAGPASTRSRAAAAKGSGVRDTITMPVSGRGLTLHQQQALVQRLLQAEEVMDLLQQDLRDALQAQEQLQQQLQEQQQPADSTGQCLEAGTGTAADAGAQLHALQQQLQAQLQESDAAKQQLAAAEAVAVAQLQRVAELQEQLHLQQLRPEQQVAAFQREVAQLTQHIQFVQQDHQELLSQAAASAQQQGQQGQQVPQQAGPDSSSMSALCCQHEARCRQLEAMLQALLVQLQALEHTNASCLRPQTAAVQGSPGLKSTWQHRPVGLHTWLCPPQLLQQTRPMMYSSSSPRCNTSGPLSARPLSLAAAQPEGAQLQSQYRLRPLTYRGPDREAAVCAATGGRRRLSADAELGLLASLRVAPVSARSLKGPQAATASGRAASSGCSSPRRSPRRGAQAEPTSAQSGRAAVAAAGARRGVPRLALSTLH